VVQPKGNSSSSSSSTNKDKEIINNLSSKPDKEPAPTLFDVYTPILERWNTFARENNLHIIISIKKNRLTSLRQRLKEKEFDFDNILEMIKQSPHLIGENERGWTVTFDWILKPSNYIKIIEGQFLKRGVKKKSAGQRWLERGENQE